MLYNDDHNTMQFCNGSDWIDMGGGPGRGMVVNIPECTQDAFIVFDGPSGGLRCEGTGDGGGGSAPSIASVFSTDLYTGNGSSQTITNGIDLSGEGGLVWIKNRSNNLSNAYNHSLADSVRGLTSTYYKNLTSNNTSAEGDPSYGVSTFNADGFTLGGGGPNTNASGQAATYVAWTFREAPKFFDIVTYTGDGTSGRAIAHDLGVRPGMVILKRLGAVDLWPVQAMHSDSSWYQLRLNDVNAGALDGNGWTPQAADTNNFFVSGSSAVNAPSEEYVAYLFAHDDSEDGVIQCGSYTGNGSSSGPTVTLGWQPQWLFVKAATRTGDWRMYDQARGLTSGADGFLLANSSQQETLTAEDRIAPSSTGFSISYGSDSDINSNGETYVYCAIRGEESGGGGGSAPSVASAFSTTLYTGNGSSQTITNGIDLAGSGGLVWAKDRNGPFSHVLVDTVRGATFTLNTNTTGAQTSPNSIANFSSTGFDTGNGAAGAGENGFNYVAWTFRETPKFFDIVTWTGDGTSGRQVAHDLGVAPGMMLIKRIDGSGSWAVYHRSVFPSVGFLQATNEFGGSGTVSSGWFNDTNPTSAALTLGDALDVNGSGSTYIAYLFAHDPGGIIQCGSYTGNGSNTGPTVDLGWQPQFILGKRADSTGDWRIWDTTMDRRYTLKPNSSGPQGDAGAGNGDIAFLSTGFQLQTSAGEINGSGGTFIYCAIRAE